MKLGVYRNTYLTRKEAELSVFQWIETWYNTNRIHSSLGNKSIKEFEKSIINNKLESYFNSLSENHGQFQPYIINQSYEGIINSIIDSCY